MTKRQLIELLADVSDDAKVIRWGHDNRDEMMLEEADVKIVTAGKSAVNYSPLAEGEVYIFVD